MDLNGKWKLYYRPQEDYSIDSIKELEKSDIPFITANVPGNVELDLSKAGVLPEDLFMGMNITETEKFEYYEWWYVKTFIPERCDDGFKAVLHFGAVDCFADYFLNDEKIGESHNMFIENDFDVTDKLNYGEENSLLVHIKSPTYAVKDEVIDLNISAFSWHQIPVASYVRKAQHSYGWDIMPRAVSAGIWRDVSLDYVPEYGFNYIHFETIRLEGPNAVVNAYYDLKLPKEKVFAPLRIQIIGKCGDSEFDFTCKSGICRGGRICFTIPNAKLWWPKNYGEPNMYDIKVIARDQDGNILAETARKQGFRKLAFRHTELVQPGGKFEFVINDVKIMAVGSNWVPMDAFHSRDKERYAKALELADDIGCNILRCWGGNVYEDREFFEFCDEHGIMVWQDFGFACKYYPQTPEFLQIVREEVESVVSKLRDYCSLVIWCGDNELDAMMDGVYNGYKNMLNVEIKPSVNKITRELIPDILNRLDPFRPYIASSPFISDEAVKLGSKAFPEDHLWGPRDYFKSDFYTGSNAYFVSETGYHGCPSKESIEKFITPEKLWPYDVDNKEWNLHSSDQANCPDRILLMFNQIKQLFGLEPKDLDEFVEASQISQAEAFKFFIERVRCKMDTMGGVIWWNLLDGWPQLSDAVVDYYYDKKLAYDYIKRSSRDFIVMIGEMRPKMRPVICSNMSRDVKKGTVTVTDLETDEVVFQKEFTAGANCNTTLGTIPAFYSDKGMLLIEWELHNGEKHFNTYLYGTPGFDLQKYKGWLAKINSLED